MLDVEHMNNTFACVRKFVHKTAHTHTAGVQIKLNCSTFRPAHHPQNVEKRFVHVNGTFFLSFIRFHVVLVSVGVGLFFGNIVVRFLCFSVEMGKMNTFSIQ